MNVLRSKLQAYTSHICCVSHWPGEIIWLIEQYVLEKVERGHTSSRIAHVKNIIGSHQVCESLCESIRWYFEKRIIFSTQEHLNDILLMEHHQTWFHQI